MRDKRDFRTANWAKVAQSMIKCMDFLKFCKEFRGVGGGGGGEETKNCLTLYGAEERLHTT